MKFKFMILLFVFSAFIQLTYAQRVGDGTAGQLKHSKGDVTIEMTGLHMRGYLRYINHININYDGNIADIDAHINYNINTIIHSEKTKKGMSHWGYLRRQVNDSSLSTTPDYEKTTGKYIHIKVNGTIDHKNIENQNDTTVVSDILLSDDRDIIGSWLVSFDSPLPPSNVKNVVASLTKPLRFGDPKKTKKHLKDARLFLLKFGYRLVYVK